MPEFLPIADRLEAYESTQGMVIVQPDATIALIPVHVFGLLFRPAITTKALPAPAKAARVATKRRAKKAGVTRVKAGKRTAPKRTASTPAKTGQAKKQTSAADIAEIGRRARKGETPREIADAMRLNYHTVWGHVRRALKASPKPETPTRKGDPEATMYRCPECGTRTPTNPCKHCHLSW